MNMYSRLYIIRDSPDTCTPYRPPLLTGPRAFLSLRRPIVHQALQYKLPSSSTLYYSENYQLSRLSDLN